MIEPCRAAGIGIRHLGTFGSLGIERAQQLYSRRGAADDHPADHLEVVAIHREHEVEAVEVRGAESACAVMDRDPASLRGGPGPRVGWLANVPAAGPGAVERDPSAQA